VFVIELSIFVTILLVKFYNVTYRTY